ncbi:MAG: hypothetical protein ACKO2Z_18685, partial [Sphaerospermopsis kisseleviana]
TSYLVLGIVKGLRVWSPFYYAFFAIKIAAPDQEKIQFFDQQMGSRGVGEKYLPHASCLLPS